MTEKNTTKDLDDPNNLILITGKVGGQGNIKFLTLEYDEANQLKLHHDLQGRKQINTLFDDQDREENRVFNFIRFETVSLIDKITEERVRYIVIMFENDGKNHLNLYRNKIRVNKVENIKDTSKGGANKVKQIADFNLDFEQIWIIPVASESSE
jgi:hypothetical protein